MANGFGSLYIGASGLQSAQNALNTTANNLANVNTEGYVRQQVVFSDKRYDVLKDPTLRVNAHQSGLGVGIGDVVHARDVFLDKAYRLESGRHAFYEACYETTTYVEDLLQELDGEEFKASVEDLWESFQELAKTPADSVTQNLVLQKSELLLSRAQTLYDDLKEYQLSPNIDIHDFNTRKKNAMEYLQKGHKIKVSIRFKGRQLDRPELGKEVMLRFAEELNEVAIVEAQPKLEGRTMIMLLAPKK